MAGAQLRGPVYLDASALVKVYVREPESEQLDRLIDGRQDLVASDLAATETVSAVARRRREGQVNAEVAGRIHRALLDDIDEGLFLRAQLTPDVHRAAERLLLAQDVPLRASDALHLALATTAEAAAVVTFDQRLREAAVRIGLAVLPSVKDDATSRP
jgi:hypothetical protein